MRHASRAKRLHTNVRSELTGVESPTKQVRVVVRVARFVRGVSLYVWEYGTVRNTCARHANCHDEHMVVLDDGRIVYVALRARDRYQWVRRPAEHVWQQGFEAAMLREYDEVTKAASCASESTTEFEADEVMVEVDSE